MTAIAAGRPAPGLGAGGPAEEVGDLPDAAGFEAFARSRLPHLLRYAAALTGDPHQGADVVQEVLVRASARWSSIRRTDRPDLYVRRMVPNEHLSWRRRWHTRSVVPVDDGILHALAPTTGDPASQVVVRDELRQRLAALSRRQRTVLVLRYYEGLDDTEISEVLQLAPSTVRSTATRALAALRSLAASEEEER